MLIFYFNEVIGSKGLSKNLGKPNWFGLTDAASSLYCLTGFPEVRSQLSNINALSKELIFVDEELELSIFLQASYGAKEDTDF